MRKLILIGSIALLALPAIALGAPPSHADRTQASKQCRQERTAMGAATFGQTYGTNHNNRNAFGKCVSKLAAANHAARVNAARACRTERSADAAAFKAKYGTNHNKSNAFGKCVSSKARATGSATVKAQIAAAKACRSERKADPAAFAAKYGTNHNHRNAFGRCVSSTARARSHAPASPGKSGSAHSRARGPHVSS